MLSKRQLPQRAGIGERAPSKQKGHKMEINKSLVDTNFVIINVGANKSHSGLVSPRSEDGTFFFMPIAEGGTSPKPDQDLFPGCSNLPTFGDFVKPEVAFCVSRDYREKTVHDDPEFETFTYGDNPDTIARGKAANLKKYLANGDLLFFFAGLTDVSGSKLTDKYSFYFVGFFEISTILKKVTGIPTEQELTLFGRNAHIKRGLADPRFWNCFSVWKGSGNSQLFRKAVLFDRELAAKILPSPPGKKYDWPEDKRNLQRLGSRTRASRLLTDTREKRILLQRVLVAGNDVPLFGRLLESGEMFVPQ
jgi:hypothetical protein